MNDFIKKYFWLTIIFIILIPILIDLGFEFSETEKFIYYAVSALLALIVAVYSFLINKDISDKIDIKKIPRLESAKNRTDIFLLNKRVNTIGRDISNDIYLNNEKISRNHAVIYKFKKHYFLKDLNSTNKVYINDKEIIESILKDSDTIKFADIEFFFRLSDF